VREDDRAVAVEMHGEPNPIAAREQLFELAFALFERRRSRRLAQSGRSRRGRRSRHARQSAACQNLTCHLSRTTRPRRRSWLSGREASAARRQCAGSGPPN
jgi:hypothetical protein